MNSGCCGFGLDDVGVAVYCCWLYDFGLITYYGCLTWLIRVCDCFADLLPLCLFVLVCSCGVLHVVLCFRRGLLVWRGVTCCVCWFGVIVLVIHLR